MTVETLSLCESAPIQTAARTRVTRLPLTDALALGPGVWDEVVTRSASASPFMSWAWHRAWAAAAPRADVAASDAVVLRAADGAVEALIPVGYRRVAFHRVPATALTWAIGDLGCPDHLDVPAIPAAGIEALAPVLEELPWELLILTNLASNAVTARRLCDAFVARGYALHRRALWGCPYLDLTDDWDAYRRALRRRAVRRCAQRAQPQAALHGGDHRYDGDRFEEGWRRLVTLHEQRWNGWALHLPARRLTAASRLTWRRAGIVVDDPDLDGEPAAAWYGFTFRDTVYFYQSGRDPRWERESLGLVLMGAMIRRAIERGYRRFDFLRGEDAYKRQWTQAGRTTEEVTIFRPGWRGRSLRMLDAAAQVRARLRVGSRRGVASGETDGA